MITTELLQVAVRDRESPRERFQRISDRIRGSKGVDLYLLPEIWQTGYFSFDQYRDTSEPLDGPTLQRLSELAAESNSYLHTGSFVERDAEDRLFNTSVLLDRDGSVLTTYRKIHLFGFESEEKSLLTPGRSLSIAETDFGTVGLTTCYDLRFPGLFRALVDEGVEWFLVTSAWPRPRLEHWLLLTRTRALENHAYLLACNGAGSHEGSTLIGSSTVVDPWGIPQVRAGDGEQWVRTRLDPGEIARVRDEFATLDNRIPVDDLDRSSR